MGRNIEELARFAAMPNDQFDALYPAFKQRLKTEQPLAATLNGAAFLGTTDGLTPVDPTADDVAVHGHRGRHQCRG